MAACASVQREFLPQTKCGISNYSLSFKMKTENGDYFLTRRFISAMDSKNKHKNVNKKPTEGNGYNGLSFLSFLTPIVSMKIFPKSNSPTIMTRTRSKEWCTVWNPVCNENGSSEITIDIVNEIDLYHGNCQFSGAPNG